MHLYFLGSTNVWHWKIFFYVKKNNPEQQQMLPISDFYASLYNWWLAWYTARRKVKKDVNKICSPRICCIFLQIFSQNTEIRFKEVFSDLPQHRHSFSSMFGWLVFKFRGNGKKQTEFTYISRTRTRKKKSHFPIVNRLSYHWILFPILL